MVVRTLDGAWVGTSFEPAGCPVGLSVSNLSDAEESPSGYGTLLAEVGESFTDLADTLTSDATVIEVAAGTVIGHPIVIVHELTGASIGAAVVPRSFLHLAHHAEASLIEFYVSPSGDRLCLPVTEMLLDEGSHLAYHAIQQLGDADWQFAYQLSRVERDAELRSFSPRSAARTRGCSPALIWSGRVPSSRLAAAYLAKGAQVQDLPDLPGALSWPDDEQPGVQGGGERSRPIGLQRHDPHGQRCPSCRRGPDKPQPCALRGPHADSVPNLDIEENDVRCSHASAVGPIDADQRFYLESRGVPTEVANRLILLGFFDDLFDQVPSLGSAGYLRGLHARDRKRHE